MVKVKVNVTSKEIKKGTRACPNTCPIALALGKTFSANVYTKVVDHIAVQDSQTGEGLDINTPELCHQFIEKFDEGKKVKPFSFVLKLSNKLAKLLKPRKQYVVKE